MNISIPYKFFLPAVLTIFLTSYVLTIAIRKWTIRKQIIDVPNARSSHDKPTPTWGGLAVAISWFAGVSISFFVFNSINYKLFLALACGIPITIVSMLDNILSIPSWLRLIIQVLSASVALFILGGYELVDCGFIVLKQTLGLNIIAVFGIVWFTNLFNFIDGIDGYIGSEVLFICIAAFFLSGSEISLFLAASTAGFLILNWQPAKIFMSDAGSTLIGFTIAVLAVYSQNTNQSSIILWLMLTSVFWFDATSTLLRRIKNKEKILEAHKKHAYQRIVQFGFSHQRTVLSAMSINCIIFILAGFSVLYPKFILIFFILNLLLLCFVLRLVDSKFPFKK